MSRFNWWRRNKKKAPLQKKEALKGKSFLLQQIEHGDYDASDYYNQALNEMKLCKQEQAKTTAAWMAGADSLQHKLDEIERKYIKRYNKLMEDHHKDEVRIIHKLKTELQKEFGMDVWAEALKKDVNQDLVRLYHNYKKLAHEKLELEKNS